jgi:GSH-dependent disulfide-bond oxidoreductase
MYDLYTWHTPNGKKPAILFAELDLPYELHLVNLGQNEQKAPSYLRINPNGKIPALVDTERADGGLVVVFESGAILQYLAEKTGRFLPASQPGRAEVLSWVFWQVGGPGPIFSQLFAFGRDRAANEGAYSKFFAESKRLALVLDGRLRDREWIAGEYSIADMTNYPWFAGIAQAHPEVLEGADKVNGWLKRMEARPAVKKGMSLGS